LKNIRGAQRWKLKQTISILEKQLIFQKKKSVEELTNQLPIERFTKLLDTSRHQISHIRQHLKDEQNATQIIP
jgi:exonuclease VII large subunit